MDWPAQFHTRKIVYSKCCFQPPADFGERKANQNTNSPDWESVGLHHHAKSRPSDNLTTPSDRHFRHFFFRMNSFQMYFSLIISVGAMFYCFCCHHYKKAPLVLFSNIIFWKLNSSGLYRFYYNYWRISC